MALLQTNIIINVNFNLILLVRYQLEVNVAASTS